MPATLLPPILDERLTQAESNVRRVRLLRAVSRYILGITLLAFAAIILDYTLDLSKLGRGFLLIGWLVVVALGFWRIIVRTMRQPVNRAELAAEVERRYPTLAERLSTLIDINENRDSCHGSKNLILQLAKETSQRTKRLNFAKAVPTLRAVRNAAIATAIVLLVVSPILYATGATERIRRFILPWYSPTVVTPFKVNITSGNPVVKRGDSVTLAAFLERTKEDAVLPETASLVFRDANGDAEKKLPMAGDDKAVFNVTRPGVKENFTYCVEAGGARSEWFNVTVADAVELIDGTTITLTAPEYARATMPVKTIPGFGEFEGLEYSTAAMELKFNKPASNATLEWKSAAKATAGFQRLTLLLSDDKTSAINRHIIREDGTFRLTLFAEHDYKTELIIAARAIKDVAPTFEKVIGLSDRPLEVRPQERIPVELIVTDDFVVEKLQLEYLVGSPDGAPKVEPIPLPRNTGTTAAVKTTFTLKDKARDGETVYVRIRAFDNRQIAEEKLFPQETVFPPTGWTKLTVSTKAKPLAEQQVNGQRDKINEKLEKAAEDLKEAAKQVQLAKEQSQGKADLTEDQKARVSNAEGKAKEATQALEEAAREAALTPALRQVTNEALKISEDHVKTGEQSARKASTNPKPEERGQQLQKAQEQWETAAKKADALKDKNNELAKSRLEPRKFEELAAEQAKLRGETEQPQADPQKIAEKQKQLEQELANAVKETESLQGAKAEAEQKAAERRAAEAAKLKEEHDKLSAERNATEKATTKDRMNDLAEKQKNLANTTAGLAEQTKTASKTAGAEPLDKQSMDKAAKNLQNEKPLDALTEQEKAARELDRLADEMEKAANLRKDPQAAAKQLAQWQKDLQKRVEEFTKNEPFEKLPAHVKDRLKAEQEALAKATAKLNPPAKDAASQMAKAKAEQKLNQAAEELGKTDGDPAKAMKEAGEALDELAKAMPDRAKRLQQARAELNKIRDEQATVNRQVEEALKNADKTGATPEAREQLAKKLANAEKKQEELTNRLNDLDVPGLEARKEKATKASREIQDDMQKGYAQDLPGSQKNLGRQLERMREEIDGQTPADIQAEQLAKQQRELATETAKLGGAPLPQDLEKLQRLQREINKNLATLPTPESPELGNQAKDSAQEAEKAMRKPEEVEELKKKTKDAAEKLEKLADRMNGADAETDKVERLQKKREQAAEQAKHYQGKPVNPQASAEAQKQLQREVDELEQTRAGAAQGAKKKAMDEMQKLKATADPDRQRAQQQAAAEALADLKTQMKENGDRSAKGDRNTKLNNPGEPNSEASSKETPGLPTKDKAQQARDLAKEQRNLQKETAKAASPNGEKGQPQAGEATAKQAQKEQELAQKAGQMAEELKQAGAQNQPAAEAAQEAQRQMDRAGRESAAGRNQNAKEARGKAEEALNKLKDQTAQAAKDASKGTGQSSKNAKEAMEAAAEAGNAMKQAQDSMKGGKPSDAQAGMKKAEDALNKAAEKLSPDNDPANQPGSQPGGKNPGGNDGSSQLPTSEQLPPDLKQYEGKPWGDLPGEVQSRIIQDLKSKYGEDYARVIKLYFLDVAEKK